MESAPSYNRNNGPYGVPVSTPYGPPMTTPVVGVLLYTGVEMGGERGPDMALPVLDMSIPHAISRSPSYAANRGNVYRPTDLGLKAP